MGFDFGVMPKALRRALIQKRINEIEELEEELRNAFSALLELTDKHDPLHQECRRVLAVLDA